MNKKTLTVVIILILITLGLLYAKSRGSNTTNPVGSTQSTTQTVGEAAKLAMAIQSGKPALCKITKGEESMDYYLEGPKMRVDSMSEGKISHFLSDGISFYIWTEGENQGYKMPIPSDQDRQAALEQAKKYGGNTPSLATEADYQSLKNQGYTLNCDVVTTDPAKLAPPSSIKFQDLGAMMQAIPSSAGTSGMSEIDLKKLQEQYAGMGQ